MRTERLRDLGYGFDGSTRAALFVNESDRSTVESFAPTIFVFDRSEFERTPSNEFVARRPQRARAYETLPLNDAARLWQIEIVFVADVVAVESAFRDSGIDHQVQSPA